MSLELISESPGQVTFREYKEVPLQSGNIRIRSLFSSVKHGTEFRGFRADSADASDRFDRDFRLHIRGDEVKGGFPKSLGNMALGEIIEIGDKVTGVKVGDQVFGHLPLRETHSVEPNKVESCPEGVSRESLMYWDPAAVAVGGVRDGNVRLGDTVAVFGLGAIGQMAVQLSRMAGASWIAAIDPIERRRQAALHYGADLVLDPKVDDVGLDIKSQTDRLGVDVALETSGISQALNDALRSARFQGTVVSTAYYTGPMQGLFFSGEWHRNRVKILSSRSNSEPLPDYGWNFNRILSVALTMLVDGKLKGDGLIDPIVPFSEAAVAYKRMNTHPEEGIKLGVDHML